MTQARAALPLLSSAARSFSVVFLVFFGGCDSDPSDLNGSTKDRDTSTYTSVPRTQSSSSFGQGGATSSSTAPSTGGRAVTSQSNRGGDSTVSPRASVGGSAQATTRPVTLGGSDGNGTALSTSIAGGTRNAATTAAQGGAQVSTGTEALPPIAVYIAGDSTVCNYKDTAATDDQAGWGQMLPTLLETQVSVVNRAAGGRTAYWFYLEGAVKTILNEIKKGDYFLIQFGTNDQNTTATFEIGGKTYPRFADASTTFKTQLKQYYLDPIRDKGAIPVLITPPPRNSAYCNGGNGLAAYATAMKELGAAENVAVIDSNQLTFNYLKALCPKPTTAADERFFLKKSDGTIDGTHFQENGARIIANFITTALKSSSLSLGHYVK